LADGASDIQADDAGLLNGALPTPLYHQVYLVLRERIQSGVYADGETLPGEQELARAFDVSRITVKRALNELAANNLVSRHRGRGTIVSTGGVIPLVSGSFETLISSLKSARTRRDRSEGRSSQKATGRAVLLSDDLCAGGYRGAVFH